MLTIDFLKGEELGFLRPEGLTVVVLITKAEHSWQRTIIKRKGRGAAKVDGRSYKEVVMARNREIVQRRQKSGDSSKSGEKAKNVYLEKEAIVPVGVMVNNHEEETFDPMKDFSDKGKVSEVEEVDKITNSPEKAGPALGFDVVDEGLSDDRCVIGRLNPSITLEHVKDTVAGLKLNAIVIPLSNIRIMLQFFKEEDMQSFLAAPGEFLELCCYKFHQWDDSGEDRFSQVWVKMEGIPLFLWHQNVFKEIAEIWGTCIKVADLTVERSTMVAAWVLVEVQNKACIPPIFIESGGDKNFNVDDVLSDVCSSSEREPKCFRSERDSLVNVDLLNADTIEVVRETASNGRNVEFPKEAFSIHLEKELLSGGGFIVQSGREEVQSDFEKDNGVLNSFEGDKSSNSLEKDSVGPILLGPGSFPQENCSNELQVIGPILNGLCDGQEIIPFGEVKRKKKPLWRILNEDVGTCPISLSGISISDSNIENRNRVLRLEVEAVWEVISSLGVVFNKEKGVVLQALMNQSEI
ncbi:hypothetical protein COLO4_33176 [Corchorus olitorius]|uniref:Uncharacterized protein n=1 Tax=Corchorus olitorius TaxID=93759 RepID=A0A1R3GVW8_9ROSI|nr:hypothetical protein COLO4_33176 [Corchorus olitorius]